MLDKLVFHGPITADFLLEIDSPIKEIHFPELYEFSKDELMDIMDKIQSGSLGRLRIPDAINWKEFSTLPFGHEGPLPDERPLIIARTPDFQHFQELFFLQEFWFLHWHGGVTKCVASQYPSSLEITKCDPSEFPYILRKDEDVFKDLVEKRPRVSCSANHFRAFSAGLTAIDRSHEGPLPENRPLYFEITENSLWMLDENDDLRSCVWEEGNATWKPFDPSSNKKIKHSALTTYMFWKLLKQTDGSDDIYLWCEEGPDELFKNCQTLEFDYSGKLSNARPLIFKQPCTFPGENSVRRIVLLEDDRLIQCIFSHYEDNNDDNSVSIRLCRYSNRPPILFTAKNVVEFLQDPCRHNGVRINYDVFRDSLQLLRKSILVLQNRLLILETSKTEFWYILKGVAEKVVWRDGCLFIFKEGDIRNAPPSLLFRYFAVNEAKDCDSSLTMEIEQFRECLEQFTMVPFDYSGSLTNDSPLASVKNEIRHTCHDGAECECSEVSSVFVCFLWNGTRLTKCSWGEKKPKKVLFGTDTSDDMEVPAILKSKEFLKTLFQANYRESSRFEWFGSVDDFLDYLEEFTKLPFDFNGPLPEERPLLFETRTPETNPILFNFTGFGLFHYAYFWFLREDDVLIRCIWKETYAILHVSPKEKVSISTTLGYTFYPLDDTSDEELSLDSDSSFESD